MIGQTVSHYKILEKLGEGGMGVVYKAHDSKLDRDVALKFLPPHLAADPVEKERFLREARAASALNHPNITTVFEIDEHFDQIFLAMELVEGKSLKELIKSESLPIKKVLEIGIQVCEGLTDAAEKGIVHRDIKSDNILLTPKNQAKIMDFGLAKFKGAGQLTKAGSTVGTAAYMSPEQASGEEVDHRSDIFSFGVVLYELLTGKLPFRGEHAGGLAYSILNEEPPPLARFNDKTTLELQRIISKALAKDKAERYQHIDDMAADLRHERKNLEYAKAPVVPKPEAVHQPKKNLLKILVPASAAAVLVLLFLIFNPFKVEVSRDQTAEASQNSLAVMYFENIPDPEDKDHTGEMLANLLITSLSQVQGLEVISRERLYDIQTELGKAGGEKITPSLATQIAQRAGVKTMLLGSILQKEPELAVTARLIDVKTGKILNSQRITGYTAAKMFPMVDSLSVLVRNGLNVVAVPASPAKSVAEVTTSSPEAYRSYLEAEELAKKFYTAEAKAAVERAIELDSSFAMAYFGLSQASGATGDGVGERKALQKAWQLRKNVTEKERLQIEAAYAREVENDLVKGTKILEKLLQKYPHEQSVYDEVARNYLAVHEYEKARQIYLAGLKNDSLDKGFWNSLAYLYAGLNQREEAMEAVGRYLKIAPGEPNPYDSKGEIHFVFGEIDSALYWYRKAVSFRTDFVTIEKLGFNALLKLDYANAGKYFQLFGSTPDEFQKLRATYDSLLIPLHKGQLKWTAQALRQGLAAFEKEVPPQVRGGIYGFFGLLAFEAGDYVEMLKYVQRASQEAKKDPSEKIYARDALALAWLKNGNQKMAYKILEELKRDVAGEPPRRQQIYDYAAAVVAYEEGKFDMALEKFKSALGPQFPKRAPQFYYAVCLLKTRHLAEAIEELKRVTWWSPISLPTISLNFLPVADYWPIAAVKAHYWLGVAYEQKGDKEQARKEYEKFLEIWKNADFNSPEMADAKQRLERLKGKA
ncbi:MAG: protein kinase [candidate division Zixibacteria bacterium]|nr:protein kinase [candidate division Zixibacteria bacterium]